MFPQEITAFLRELSVNNNAEWFNINRKRYEKLRDEFYELTQAVLFMMSDIEPNFRHVTAKECVYRINRDIRFSKDKTPYKTYFSAALSDHGRKTEDPGYYFHIDETGMLRLDGGLWNPAAPKLELVRASIDTHPEKFHAIIDDREFRETFREIYGERVKTVPRGYKADNPEIEYLKLKSFVIEIEQPILDLLENELPQFISDGFKKMHPFVAYLKHAVRPKKTKSDW